MKRKCLIFLVIDIILSILYFSFSLSESRGLSDSISYWSGRDCEGRYVERRELSCTRGTTLLVTASCNITASAPIATCSEHTRLFMNTLLALYDGRVIDASANKACFTAVPSDSGRHVLSFTTSGSSPFASSGVTWICNNDTRQTSIDDVHFWEGELKPQRLVNVSAIILGEGAPAALDGALWTIRAQLVPIVLITQETPTEEKSRAAETLSDLGYRLFGVELSDGGGVAADLVTRARLAHGLDGAEHEIKKMGSAETIKDILAIKTQSIVRHRDPAFKLDFASTAHWDMDFRPEWWQFAPAKHTSRDCSLRSNERKAALSCRFVPLRLAFVFGIAERSQRSVIGDVRTWWARFPPCNISKGYYQFIDLIVRTDHATDSETSDIFLTEKDRLFQSEILASLAPYRSCFGTVTFQWAKKFKSRMDSEYALLLPIFDLLKTSHDYFFFFKGESLPVKRHWLDLLYEDLTVTPQHFWVKTSVRTIEPYIPVADHASRVQSEDSRERDLIFLNNFALSCVGFYRLGDAAFGSLLRTTAEVWGDFFQNFNQFFSMASDIAVAHESIRSAHHWVLSDTLADSPPIFEIKDVDDYIKRHPSLLVVTNVLQLRQACFVDGECVEDTNQQEDCRSCDTKSLPLFDTSSCEHCRASLERPPKHLARSCHTLEREGTHFVDCEVPTERLCVVFPINHNRKELEMLEVLSNWTRNHYPCDVKRGYRKQTDLYFRAVPLLDRTLSDARHEEIKTIMETSGILENCFQSVAFEDVELPASANNYTWATCANFFPNFFEKAEKDCSYMLFTEEDVTAVQTAWLDRVFEIVTLSPEHFWQLGSVPRYQHEPRLDHHRNGVGLYRIGDPWFDAILENARKSCPGAHDRMLDQTVVQNILELPFVWGKFPLGEFHQNNPPAFEIMDREWFLNRYPETVLVHKFNRVSRICKSKLDCPYNAFMGGYETRNKTKS